MYEGRKSEGEILKEFRVSAYKLERWLNSMRFRRELDRLCDQSLRETRFILSRYGPVAAKRLVELLESSKPEVARRAALDLLDRCVALMTGKGVRLSEEGGGEGDGALSEEQAKKMLKRLAEGVQE